MLWIVAAIIWVAAGVVLDLRQSVERSLGSEGNSIALAVGYLLVGLVCLGGVWF
jgi:hypothetical protein